jgi:hypothetical protein
MEKLTDVYTYEPYFEPKGEEDALLRGAQVWKKNGKVHRDGDLPALIMGRMYDTVAYYYYQHGVLHRDVCDEHGLLLPAITIDSAHGDVYYRFFLHGVRVNSDGMPCTD